MENTHTGRALKLSRDSRAWFAKNFGSVSVAARGSIGKGDGLIPGQEYNEGREAAFQTSAEAARATQSSQSPAGAVQRQQEPCRADASLVRAAQGQHRGIRSYASLTQD